MVGVARGQTLPAMKFVTAPLVSPSTAQTYYGTATTHTYSLAGVAGFGATPPEIVETARALKNNPDTIFDFVHDQIEAEYAFGERKGPIGALIDKSGTPFDQNVLFVNLVRQAGYAAQYQIGQVTMTAAQFANWTGVTDVGAACRMLSSGGIPASFAPTNPPSTCAASGSFTSVTLLHIWSQVQIGGTWYAYDPSFKTYAGPTPVNLISASGLVSGAAATAAATGMSSGTTSGANYIKNASESTLNTFLVARGAQLLTYLKANTPALDMDEVTGVTKIQQVYAPPGGWRNATPPGYTVVSGTNVTITGDIPDQYRTKFQVAMAVAPDLHTYVSALNWTFFVDDIDGRRIGIDTNFSNTGSSGGGNINPAMSVASGNLIPLNYRTGSDSLVVDDTVVQTWSCAINYYSTPYCYGGASPGQITLTATHPYAAGTFANETVVKQLTATAAPVAIVSGWGMISPARLTKWSDEVPVDKSLPDNGVPQWPCPGDHDVYCSPSYEQSAGDQTRQRLAASWLAEMTRMLQLQATIGGAKAEHQHSIGVVDWRHTVNGYTMPPSPTSQPQVDYYGITDQFTDLNIDTVISLTSLTDNAAQTAALSRSVAVASATLEGSVLEQMEDLPDTASTASRFAWGNNPGADNNTVTGDLEDPCWTINNPRPFFDFTGTTSSSRSGLYTYEGSASGCGYPPPMFTGSPAIFSAAADSAIGAYLAAGFHVTASAETYLGPGARFGTCYGTSSTGLVCDPSVQRGDALVATQFDGSGNVLEVAHILTSYSGISKGGGGKQPENFAEYDPSHAGDALKDKFVDRSVAIGVDLKTGTAGYTTPTLMSVGTGSAPYKLDYSLTFKAAATGCDPFGPCTGAITGGWNHNWDVRFTNSGSGEEAMGATSPFAAAGTIAAYLAMQDIFGETSLANLNQDVYAALTADWWRQQMVANVATISQGFSGKQYVRLVDSSWMPPVGDPGVLTQTGARVKTRDDCYPGSGGSGYSLSTSRYWDNSTVSFSLRNAGGDVLAFTNWTWRYDLAVSDKCARLLGYMPTTWTWPQGPSITFTYGSVAGPQTPDQGVIGVSTSLGRSLTFNSGEGAVTGYTATGATGSGGTVTVGQTAMGAIVDANGSTSGGATGAQWGFQYTPILARTASQRPVPYPQLYQVFEPVSTSLPALQYGYDTRGLVETAKDANGLQWPANAGLPPYSFYLALTGRGERDDPDGGAYTVYYDTDGNAVRNIDEIGREVDSLWDGRHRVTSRTFPETDQEQFAYDANDNVLSLTRVAKTGSGLASTSVSATYEPTWNHLATITDALLNTTSFVYYPAGVTGASLMETATRPAVTGGTPVYTFTYNAIGLPTQTVDPAGITTAHAYDSYGNLTSTTEGAAAVGSYPALNLTTTFTPDSIGNVTQTSDPLSHVSNQTFDFDRRTVLSIEPNPGTGVRTASKTTYDLNGRAIQVDKGTTNTSGGSFTALETSTTAFDPNGNKIQVSALNGPLGSAALTVSQTSYDALNRPICTAVRENAAVFTALPTSACAQSLNGPYGPDQITQLTYDLAGQKLVETRGLGSPVQIAYATYTYGLDGELATILDANHNLTTNLYDGFNRLSKLEFPSTTIGSGTSDPTDVEAYAYDPNDNRTSLTKRDGTTVINFGYDALNRQITKALPATTLANVSYGYDLAGRRTSALYANVTGTPGVVWLYDAAGREISEATNGRTLTFTYDPASNPAALTWPDLQSITYTFDGANRFTNVGNTAVAIGFSYDALSRMTGISRSGSSSTLGYDNADRLVTLNHALATSPVSYSFGYTPADQIASSGSSSSVYDWPVTTVSNVATTVNGLNQIATVAGVTNTYDHNGNLTSDGTRTFTYDAENRLLSDTVGGSTVLALAYDPLGRLQQTAAGSTVVQYLYDGDHLVAEYDNSGNVLRRFIHGPASDNPVIWFEGSGTATANASYLIADHQGSIIATTNTSGTVTNIYLYDVYGVPYAWPTVPLFGYTGQLALPQASLWHYKARAYDPVSGRFLQTDPVGYGPDVNLYSYVGGDPVDRRDPAGLAPGDPFGSRDEAAIDALNYINPTSIRTNLEYAGYLYEKGGNFYASEPRAGTESDNRHAVPRTANGDYHTHADRTVLDANVDDPEEMSDLDKDNSHDLQRAIQKFTGSSDYRSYLGTPSGAIKSYDPSTNTETTLVGPTKSSNDTQPTGSAGVLAAASAAGIDHATISSTGVVSGTVTETGSRIPKDISVCANNSGC
jgi:RHS repeat-associated protein